MSKNDLNVTLKGIDELLFSTEEQRQEEKREQVQQIPIDELHPFTNHPFKVLDDDSMKQTVESIKQYGVLSPLIARPRPDGDGYEIISGHRRQFAARQAGLETLPVLVREMEDDAATILMIDSNLQREHILPSERAFAYKMKLDAIKHQGARSDLTCGQIGHKLAGAKARDIIAEQFGDNPLFTVMLGTGCRIGEVLGLRWQDVDFKNRTISINHNLVYRVQEDGTCTNHVNSPKTKAGIRIIPMLDEVFDAFLEEYQYQKVIGFCTDEIDGYSGFVFCTGDGKVYLPNAINRTIRSICADYNKEEESKAKEENRDPVLLPKFSCHILRHTFCTRFCENETNLKVIQEIMGHADISTTMDVYAEATQEKKKESMTSLQSALLVR